MCSNASSGIQLANNSQCLYFCKSSAIHHFKASSFTVLNMKNRISVSLIRINQNKPEIIFVIFVQIYITSVGLYTCESSESCVHRTPCTVFCSILNILLANFIVCKFVYQKYTKTEKYCIICNNKLNYTCVYKCVYMCGGSKTKRDIGPLLVRRRLTYWAGHGQNTAQKASVGHIYTYTLTHLLFWTQRQTELLACP